MRIKKICVETLKNAQMQDKNKKVHSKEMDLHRWGVAKHSDIFGEHTCAKIAVVQATVLIMLLYILQPKFVTYTVGNQYLPRLDVFKVLLVACLGVAITYLVPAISRST